MAVEENSTIPVRIPQPSNDSEALPRVGASQALPQGKVQMATIAQLREVLGLPTDPLEALIASGSYTPVIVDGTNVDGSASPVGRWQRIGSVVTVFGSVLIDPTVAAGTPTDWTISLPVASNLVNGSDVSGVVQGPNAEMLGDIIADTANDVAEVFAGAFQLNSSRVSFTFSYEVA